MTTCFHRCGTRVPSAPGLVLPGRSPSPPPYHSAGGEPVGKWGQPSEEPISQASNPVLHPVSLESSEESALVCALEANQLAFWLFPKYCDSDRTGTFQRYGINRLQKGKTVQLLLLDGNKTTLG